jgi:REP element-mobilizing transposase RayT
MPARNVVKQYSPQSYYHIYNRGVENRHIFTDKSDYEMFLELLRRHLTREPGSNPRGKRYETYAGRIELLSFTLQPTHFHLLCYLDEDTKAIAEFMRKIAGSYTSYFNKKHDREGHLFQGVYKASKIDDETTLLHITRYIHRENDDYYNWPYSSLPYYIKDWHADWVVPDKVYRLYEWGTYESYLNDASGYHATLPEIRHALANTIRIN